MVSAKKAFHWAGLLLSLPIAIFIVVKQDPRQLELFEKEAALNMPYWAVAICGECRHLTVISLLLDAGYFAARLLREHGLVSGRDTSSARTDWLDVYFPIVLTIALFVSTMFWSLMVADTQLLVEPAMLFGDDAGQPWVRWITFQMAFGPNVKGHEWLDIFLREFQRHIHTTVPLLVVADAVLLDHAVGPWKQEVQCLLASLLVYFAWNLSCWWFLHLPPYPVQKQIHELGFQYEVLVYLALFAVAVGLLRYSQNLRGVKDWRTLALASPPILYILWANLGFTPFKVQLARWQGIDPDNIWGENAHDIAAASEIASPCILLAVSLAVFFAVMQDPQKLALLPNKCSGTLRLCEAETGSSPRLGGGSDCESVASSDVEAHGLLCC